MTERDVAEAVAVMRELVGNDNAPYIYQWGDPVCFYCRGWDDPPADHQPDCPITRARDWLARMED